MEETMTFGLEGVPMSMEKRPPRELLKKIGISGKEVVTILKQRKWRVEGPKKLQQENIYFAPGTPSGTWTQRKDFFVGEGELYAFILKQGGLRYLVPDADLTESDESEVEATQPVVETKESEEESENSDDLPDSEQRKWKRRKKLSTGRVKSVEKTEEKTSSPSSSVEKTSNVRVKKRRSKKKTLVDTDEDRTLVSPRVKQERATYVGCGQQAEFSEYESSLKAKGWRVELLKEVDVHLLRSLAVVDRRQRTLDMSTEGKKKSSRPVEGVGPHVKDEAEVVQELDGLMHSIRAAQDDLSFMMESIIAQGERLNGPDRIDPVGGIGIPRFVSTGTGGLMLLRDIERYLLVFGAAVRRYQRQRKTVEAANVPSQSSNRSVKRPELRALQLKIEESKSELQDLSVLIDFEVRKMSNTSGTAQEISQETSPSFSSPVREVGTNL